MSITKEQVQDVLNMVRPSLQADGGDVELVEIKEEKVYLRLMGHCKGCAYSQMTLRNGIEKVLKEKLSPTLEVIGVE
jgi:Fe-S cluster biogenesis protein NfuA